MNRIHKLVSYPNVYNKNLISFAIKGSFHTSPLANGLVKMTPEKKMADFNKTQYLHRNDTLGCKKVFYRGKVKVDWSQGRPRKPKPEYEPKKKLDSENELPLDDVYIISDYKQQQLDLPTSISRVKKYALLDFAAEDAIVNLKLSFKSLLAGGKKKKKQSAGQPRFLQTTKVPHDFNSTPKVAVFTDQDSVEEEAIKNGAFAAGSIILTRQVLNGIIECDAYMCTQAYSKILSNHKELKLKLGNHLPNRQFGVHEDDELIARLRELTSGVLIDNFSGDGKSCTVKVGRINQSEEDIAANVRHVITEVERVLMGKNRKLVRGEILTTVALSSSKEEVEVDVEGLQRALDDHQKKLEDQEDVDDVKNDAQ